MASNTEIILVCDFCGTEDKSEMVETHRVTVDGTSREAELYEGEQVWVRDEIKVVVEPNKQHILTASKRNSDDYEDLQAVG